MAHYCDIGHDGAPDDEGVVASCGLSTVDEIPDDEEEGGERGSA